MAEPSKTENQLPVASSILADDAVIVGRDGLLYQAAPQTTIDSLGLVKTFATTGAAQVGSTGTATAIIVAGQTYKYDASGTDLTTGDARTWTRTTGSTVVAGIDTFTGDGTSGPFALSLDPGTEKLIDLVIGGAAGQRPTTDYALVTMGSSPSGKGIEIYPSAPDGVQITAILREPSESYSATDPDLIQMPDGRSVEQTLDDFRDTPTFKNTSNDATVALSAASISTNRTLTLPDETGTLATQAGLAAAMADILNTVDAVSVATWSFTPAFKFASPGTPTPAAWSYGDREGIVYQIGSLIVAAGSVTASLTKNSVLSTEPLLLDLATVGVLPTNALRFGGVTNVGGALDLPLIVTGTAGAADWRTHNPDNLRPSIGVGNDYATLVYDYPQYPTATVTAAEWNTAQQPFALGFWLVFSTE